MPIGLYPRAAKKHVVVYESRDSRLNHNKTHVKTKSKFASRIINLIRIGHTLFFLNNADRKEVAGLNVDSGATSFDGLNLCTKKSVFLATKSKFKQLDL